MSNLSELLPAGSSVKSADFVAQGTLASGLAVGLRSDGKVEAIGVASGTVGTPAVFLQSNVYDVKSTFDSYNNVVIVVYRRVSTGHGFAVIGAVNGTAISFGTPITFTTNTPTSLAVTYDSASYKVVIAYRDTSNNNYGTAIVGNVSGTPASNISFGSAVVYESASTQQTTASFDSTNNKVVIAYKDDANSNQGTAIVGTVSSTSISFGSAVVFETSNSEYFSACYDSVNGKTVIAYVDSGNDPSGGAVVGTISGTSISFGSPVHFGSSSMTYTSATYDVTNEKVVIAYADGTNTSGRAIVGTVSGTSISFGSPAVFEAASSSWVASAYEPTQGYHAIAYTATNGKIVEGRVSGTSISFVTAAEFVGNSTTNNTVTYDATNKKIAIAYRDAGNSNYGTGVVYSQSTTNVTSFVGITDQAISSAATGKVVCKGGAITNTGLLPLAETFGSKVVFEAAISNQRSSAFDSANNKIVIAYQDSGNSNYGTAIVGTVSGNSITFGTPAVFASHSMQYSSTVYDPDTQKIIISYRNSTSGSSGLAVVGTVSGTSISFGTAVEYAASSVFIQEAVYDTANNKVVITYDDVTQNATRSIVGTVSGTSISFGTAVSVNSNRGSDVSAAYDSANGKIVVAYKESSRGKARVGTVSGTSISFGGETNFSSGNLFWPTVVYDVQNEKTLIAFRDSDNSDYGTAVVGTVSGTSISFGSATVFNTGITQSIQGTYDSTNNVVALSYADNPNSNQGTAINGTISGTSVSFGSATVFNTTDTSGDPGAVISYDTNAKKLVYAFTDSGNSNYGTAIVGNLSNALTPNTAYFVQDDGTISTTSSTTKAGTALSTTSLLLTG